MQAVLEGQKIPSTWPRMIVASVFLDTHIMDDRSNTIAGWVLAGGIAALGFSIFSGMAFHSETPKEGKQGYAIQGVEASGAAGVAATPLPVLLAAADPVKGEAVFKKCMACHTVASGGANGIGPNLYATLGEGIGQGKAGYAFSSVLSGKGGKWDFANMDEWLSNPKKFAPGTKMTFAGLGDPKERADVILYLNSQGSNLPLPKADAAPAADAAAPAAAPGDKTAAPVTGAAPADKAAVPAAAETPKK
jgi:cytochrome c